MQCTNVLELCCSAEGVPRKIQCSRKRCATIPLQGCQRVTLSDAHCNYCTHDHISLLTFR